MLREEKIEQKSIERLDTKEKYPKLDLVFLYAPHVTEKDAEKIKENLKNADIYCPENLNWSEKVKKDLNKISQGDKKMYYKYVRLCSRDWWKSILKIIYNSKKIIWFIDASAKEKKLVKEFKKIDEIRDKALNYFYLGELNEAVNLIKKYVKQNVSFEEKREEIIINNIKGLSAKVVSKYPELRQKSKLKVLMTLGRFHTYLYHKMKEDNYLAKFIFNQKPYVYANITQVDRSYRFKKKKEFSNEFYARIFIEGILYYYFSKYSLRDSTKVIAVAKNISSKINWSTFKELSIFLKSKRNNNGQYYNRSNARNDIIKFLKEKGIDIPDNISEFDRIASDFENKFQKR